MNTPRRLPVPAVVAAVALAGGGLRLAAPLDAVLSTLSHPAATAQAQGVEALASAAAAAVCWLLLGWLALATGLTVSAAVPGPAGRLAGRVAGWTVPRVLRQALSIGVGAAVATAGAPAFAAPTSAFPAQPVIPSTSVATVPDLDWPLSSPPRVPRSSPPASSSAGAAAGRRLAPSAVVVRPGDSLWSIARASLAATRPAVGPSAQVTKGATGRTGVTNVTNQQVAAAWPRWYTANRTVIGPVPDVLIPGQRLVPPHPPIAGAS